MIHPDDIALIVIRSLSLQSLYSVILFPVIWGLVRCSRLRYPQWQHGLWLLILFRLVIPPDAAFIWSAGNLIQSHIPQIVSRPFSELSKASFNFHDKQDVSAAFFSNGSLGYNKNTSENIRTPVIHNTNAFSSPTFKSFCLSICCIWLTITTFLIVRFLQNRHRFWKTAWNGKKLLNPDVLDLAEAWQRRLHINRKIILKSDPSNGPPFTIGLLRPVVVLPQHLLSKPGNTILETVLAHELVHVKRWDDLFIYFQEILRIVYFFNPVVWYIMPRLSWTREAACDAAVIFHGTISPKNYSRQILAFLKTQSVTERLPRNFAGFTSAARGMAFRLISIQKEENMKYHPIKTYLALFFIGFFLLPMSPVISSGQSDTEEALTEVQDQDLRQTGKNPLNQYILNSVQCQNPDEVSLILWGEQITEKFQKEDFFRLAAATDFDIVDNIGNGQKAYVFYLLGSSRKGIYRPSFHFIKKQGKLILVYKSLNVSAYVIDQAKINGHYQISEGWRADLFNGTYDDRVKLAWGSRFWFWTGKKYLPAYTDITIKDAIDPSLLGTQREWNYDTKSLYEAASRE